MSTVKKALLIVAGSICAACGVVGTVIPVLPTTPLLLLAAFLFSRSSERLNAWLAQTRVYRSYVEPFRRSGGLPLGRKVRILAISIAAMAVSGIVVGKWYVWLVLGAVTAFLLWLMVVRIPTVSGDDAAAEPARGLSSDCE